VTSISFLLTVSLLDLIYMSSPKIKPLDILNKFSHVLLREYMDNSEENIHVDIGA